MALRGHRKVARVALGTLVSLLAGWVSACGGGPPAPESPALPRSETPTSAQKASRTAQAAPAEVPRARPPAPEPASGEEKLSSPPAGYPLPAVTPPYERSAQAGDGQWSPFGGASDSAGEGRPVLHRTLLHPHPTSRFIALTVVAIDLTAVTLHFMPGTEDVGKGTLPFSPGLVPVERQNQVLAVFNGGFQPKHGRWGMRLGDTTIVPPRDIGCTVALGTDGSVRIRSYPELPPSTSSLAALRQTPPCLLEQGAVHEDLIAGRDKIWAGRTPGLVTRRRSAIGIDRSGRVLFYGIGVEATPKLLAEGMRAAGAYDAAQLDINWNWTRFLLFGKDERGGLAVSSSLVEGDYAKTGYVSRPSERDFFYLLRR